MASLLQIYNNLPRTKNGRFKIRNQICNELNISVAIFYNYLKGVTPVPHLAKPIIAKLLNFEEREVFKE